MADTDDINRARAGRPLILVAPRYELCQPCLKMPERLAPEETAATVFLDAILAAGGLPLVMSLTDDDDVIAEMVSMADGIAVPGGHDVSPALWGDNSPYDEQLLCPERDAFEVKLIKAAIGSHTPLFCACRGMQVLNVALGGSLCMDVPSRKPESGMALWRHTAILNDPAHPVEIKAGSLLERAVGGFNLVQANSSHHCCVDRLGEGVELVACATDGIPEAIEVPGERFCLGVQWHPEYTWRKMETDFNLWKSFVSAAAAYRESR
ncbi:gamma-glutamyl-gamma-aminobutyrate hydrolase family protein [Collinsella tanakaei]|uniref:Gamma-glutamyl-gamma-aminobutyrate hydrolase family protein n=1 Tax=Collinsella ihumii TaxID=1720204 RepID=A0AAW7JY68_9ACTN|nr:gamma-glutamyl-gamma-aminobutyrate hydrolase family protein [Collinsella ihumii]MBM6785008.1 gamma-glutamyl-gamma-aminobutyrate hydrolase family protein [Collinsella tanakaei]MDN0068321.1 gamma-glutamyl-gamma-aminobutyrate hydrolase family protein [Collinsella ihumii]